MTADQSNEPIPPSPQVPPPETPVSGPADIEQNKDARTMGMLCHLLGIFTGFLGPLIVWLVKKDEFPFVDDQGKEALNWHITLLIGWIIAAALMIICIGAFLGLAISILQVIFGILGAVKANEGIRYRYPFAIRLVK